MTTTTTLTCDARTGEAPDDYGMRPLWCRTWIGLREFFDAQGVVRRYCASVGHKDAVVGRFGKLRGEDPTPRVSTFSGPDWETRKAAMDAEMRLDVDLMADEFHGRVW